MPQSMQDNILEVTGIRLRGNDRKKHLRQMIAAIDKVDDDQWNRLLPKVQAWYEATYGDSEALDKDPVIEDFAAQSAAPAAAEKPKAKKETTVVKKTTKAKAKPKHNGGKERPGAPVLIRRLLYRNPKLSHRELIDKLTEKWHLRIPGDISPGLVSATRSICIAQGRELAHMPLEQVKAFLTAVRR